MKARKRKNEHRRWLRQFERRTRQLRGSWPDFMMYHLTDIWLARYCEPMLPILKERFSMRVVERLALRSPLIGMLPRAE